MAEPETRWPCPVCLGATMEKVSVAGPDALTLDHCPRCGGVWLDAGEVPRLRARTSDALWSRVDRREPPSPRCHACHALLGSDADACPACGHRVSLLCPPCSHPMERGRHGELTLDVCRRCRGVWFDHHELDALWKLELGEAALRRRTGDGQIDAASDVLLHTLFFAPDLMFYGAYAATEVVAAGARGVAHAPEAVTAAVEVAGAAAEGVFEAIVEAVASIFDLFG